jgi:uncharacterized protein (DUF1330 family)
MAVIAVLTYDVDDADVYKTYVPGSLGTIIPSIQKHGGAPIFSGPADTREGGAKTMHVGIKFPDADAFDAWLAEPDYAEAKAIRLSCTSNYHTFVIDALG